MGNRQPREEIPERLYCSICYDIDLIDQFRVLRCGHYYCRNCLEEWGQQNMTICPICRNIDDRQVDYLDTLHNFEGRIFFQQPGEGNAENLILEDLMQQQLIRRARTIRNLKKVANVIRKIEFTSHAFKITGSLVGLIGTGLMITGGVLSFTGVGAVAGVPLLIVGAAVGSGGAVAVGGSFVGEAVDKHVKMKDINEQMRLDFFHSMQIRILAGRAARNEEFANTIGVPIEEVTSVVNILGRAANLSVNIAVAVIRPAAAAVARGTVTAGSHIAGFIIGAALIPIDIGQVIYSSYKIHKGDKSAVVKDVERVATDLEVEFWPLLHEKGYKILQVRKCEVVDNNNIVHLMLLAIKEESDPNLTIDQIEENCILIEDSIGEPVNEDFVRRLLAVVPEWVERVD